MKAKGHIVFAVTVIASVLFIGAGFNIFKDYRVESYDDYPVYKARVLSADSYEENLDSYNNIVKTTFFSAEITDGAEKGRTISCSQETGGMFSMYEKEVEAGDNILVSRMEDEQADRQEWVFGGYNRLDGLILLCLSFFALIVIIGHMKGVKTIVSLVFSCAAVFLVYVPSILSGFPVYVSTVLVGIFIILMSLLLINGADSKTLCAVMGNAGGVLVAAALAFFMNKALRMTGFIDENYIFLSLLNPDKPLDLLAIVWGGMVLGSIGAIMDVAMSIASAMHELAEHMDGKSFSKMFRSGMNIGRDAIGTMTNTLILAYIGSSLALVLLLMVHTKNTITLFSMEMIAVQVVQAVTGSMGILFAVPFTALFSAYIYCGNRS